jgi:hypothetical protein
MEVTLQQEGLNLAEINHRCQPSKYMQCCEGSVDRSQGAVEEETCNLLYLEAGKIAK